MSTIELSQAGRQIYWSAPSPGIDRGLRRLAFGLVLVLGCERLLREGRLRGREARLAAAQAQAARLLAVTATGARWPTRRGDVLRRSDDGLAAALTTRAAVDDSPAARLMAAHDLLEEIGEWLVSGALTGAAAPSAVDRLRVAQALLREHRLDEPPADDDAPPPGQPVVVPSAWLDDE